MITKMTTLTHSVIQLNLCIVKSYPAREVSQCNVIKGSDGNDFLRAPLIHGLKAKKKKTNSGEANNVRMGEKRRDKKKCNLTLM